MTDRQKRITEWVRKINVCVEQYKALDKAMSVAISAGCMDIEGPLHHAVWKAFETMVRMVDSKCWILWHIYDNDCGERGLSVRNSTDLAKLIVWNEDSLTPPER